MKNFAGRLYNKDENDILGIVEAENKNHARKLLREQYGKEYKIGQIFETEWAVGKIYVDRKRPKVLRKYEQEKTIELLEERVSLLDKWEIEGHEAWLEKHEDADPNGMVDGYKKSFLPKLGLTPIEPGSKYDRIHFDEHGREITRKEWKRRRKAALAS